MGPMEYTYTASSPSTDISSIIIDTTECNEVYLFLRLDNVRYRSINAAPETPFTDVNSEEYSSYRNMGGTHRKDPTRG